MLGLSGELQVKVLTALCCALLILGLLFGLIASNGGSWSITTSVIHEVIQNATIATHTTGVYGLQSYVLNVPNFINNVVIPYTDARANAQSHKQWSQFVDFDDLVDGGRGTTAFLVLALLVTPFAIFAHLGVWPMRRKTAASWTLPLTAVATTFHLFTLFFWTTVAHRAAKHVAIDSYPEVLPEIEHAYCYGLIAAAFAFGLIATVVTIYQVYYLFPQAAESATVGTVRSDEESQPLHSDSKLANSAAALDSSSSSVVPADSKDGGTHISSYQSHS